MINLFYNSFKSKKAVAMVQRLNNCFVNLTPSKGTDLTGENIKTRQVFFIDFILKKYNMSIDKILSCLLYNKFSKVSITY